MRLLLDTHIWLWGLLDPGRLTERVIHALEREDTELWLSPISVWELLTLAPVTHEVALETRNVRLAHRDPADRFLVATALVFDLKLVTADARLLDLKEVPILANR